MENVKTVSFVSLGCKKNLVDTEVMIGLLKSAGYEIVSSDVEADMVIINTCCFIDQALKEADDTIKEFEGLKLEGKIKQIFVTGCLPQRYGKEIKKLYPSVDGFLGSGDFPLIVKFVKNHDRLGGLQIGKPDYIYSSHTPRVNTGYRHSVFVKVAEGCSETCTFCIIPKLRGKYRSRTQEDIASEIREFVARGAKEINLIAQNLTSYGRDIEGTSLFGLVKKLLDVKGFDWLRLIYNYPRNFTEELIDLIAGEPRICNYVDLPIQHIDDDILKKMGRRTSERHVRGLLDKMKARINGLVLRSSFIVGFPGETDEKFRRLVDFIKEYEFDKVAVFPYSRQKGSAAFGLGDGAGEDVKLERYDELTEVKKKVALRKNEKFVNNTFDVLVDRVFKDGDYEVEGRFYGQSPEIDGCVKLRSRKKISPGIFLKATFIDADPFDFRAVLDES